MAEISSGFGRLDRFVLRPYVTSSPKAMTVVVGFRVRKWAIYPYALLLLLRQRFR